MIDLEGLEKLAARLRQIVKSYEAKNPLRTADFHGEDCSCYRCAVDACDAAVNALPELLERVKRLEEAFSGPAAWLDRWAQHVGNCKGGDVCTCGLTFVRTEAAAALNQETGQ